MIIVLEYNGIGVKECRFWDLKRSFLLKIQYKDAEKPRSIYRSAYSLCAKRLGMALCESGGNM